MAARKMLYSIEVNALRDVMSTGWRELRPLFGRTLMASILDKAFKGEL